MKKTLIILFVTLFLTNCGTDNFSADKEHFKNSIEDFAKAGELTQELDKKSGQVSNEEAAEYSKKVSELIKHGLSESNLVRDEFLNSVDDELKDKYRNDLVYGNQLIMNLFETRDFSKLESIQKIFDEKNISFYSYYSSKQDKINKAISKKSKTTIWTALVFILKAFIILSLLFYIALGITNMLLVLIGRSFLNSIPRLEMPFIVLAHLVFIYLYGFFGSYFNELTVAYHGKLKDWLIYSVCIISLITYFRFSRRSLLDEKIKGAQDTEMLAEIVEKQYEGEYSPKGFSHSMTIIGLRLYWVPFISFAIFHFFPNLIPLLYGDLALKIANWFL